MEPKAELQNVISELTDFILDLAPEVEVRYEPVIYEDEHANLTVYPPLTWNDEQCMALRHTIYERVSHVHLESGYLVLVDIMLPEQQVAEAQQAQARARKALDAAEKILAEAYQIGLLQPDSMAPERIAA